MEIIKKYFPDLDAGQLRRFAMLESLYSDWNARINVISRKDIDLLYERHVLHSLAIGRLISFKKGSHVLDAGTGGGFPGIPLAILFPETSFFLVDSIGKKIKVVKEVAAALGLKNVEALNQRVETLDHRFDFVVSRAVTQLPRFYAWVKGNIGQPSKHELANGVLYLKGGDLSEELKSMTRPLKIYPISDFFEEAFFAEKYIVHVASS